MLRNIFRSYIHAQIFYLYILKNIFSYNLNFSCDKTFLCDNKTFHFLPERLYTNLYLIEHKFKIKY